MIEDELFTLLAPLTIGDAVYPVEAPEDAPSKRIVYHTINRDPNNNLDGSSGLHRWWVQIDCFDVSYEDARSLMNAVKAAFAGWAARQVVWLNDNPEDQDEESRLFAFSSDFAIWHD